MSRIDIILIVVLAIILVLVGGKKLPELARGIGQAGKEIKKGFKDDDNKDEK
jgi:sec-independent protein translocase protein TatA